MTARSRGNKERANSIVSMGVVFIEPTAALR
jgi:hypothetical protein